MASPGFSEILTTTLRNRSGDLADDMTNNNAILSRMNSRGSIQKVSGGRTIVQEMAYAENSSFQFYSGYETVNVSPSDVVTASEYDWKQASVAVTASGLEVDVMNTGDDAIIDLMASRMENADNTFKNQMGLAMYSDGTAFSGKGVGGLQLLIADDPTTGTVGGINRATWAFWRNQYWRATTDGGAPVSAANITSYMNRVYNRCVRGNDMTDLIIADDLYYGFYESSLQNIQRVTTSKMADAGFTALAYKGSDVVLDGGHGGNCPGSHMYGLNTRYIKWRPHTGRNMTPLETVQAINQDATVKLIVWAGAMTLSNAFVHFVMREG